MLSCSLFHKLYKCFSAFFRLGSDPSYRVTIQTVYSILLKLILAKFSTLHSLQTKYKQLKRHIPPKNRVKYNVAANARICKRISL